MIFGCKFNNAAHTVITESMYDFIFKGITPFMIPNDL